MTRSGMAEASCDASDLLVQAAPVAIAPEQGRLQTSDALSLLVLAGFWGGSFLFMRVGTPEFGPVALIEVRVLIASLFLLPILTGRGGLGQLKQNVWPTIVIGVINSALPFCLLAFATLRLTA